MTNPYGETFGGWLRVQRGREDEVGALAMAARHNPGFPAAGDPEAVRRHLRACAAGADLLRVVDTAEMDWLSY